MENENSQQQTRPIPTGSSSKIEPMIWYLYENGAEVGIRLPDGQEFKGEAYYEYLKNRKRPMP